MKVRLLLIAMAICVLGGGCRSRMDPSIDLLESELRWMEDQLYLLDDQVEVSYAQLASCRRENQSLRRELQQLGQDGDLSGQDTLGRSSLGRGTANPGTVDRDRSGVGSSSGPARSPNARRGSTPNRRTPDRTAPPSATPDQPRKVPPADEPMFDESDLTPPEVQLGQPVPSLPPPVGSSDAARRDVLPRHIPISLRTRPSASTARPSIAAEAEAVENEYEDEDIDARVTSIQLDSRLTGGYDFDGLPGHEGLLAVIEPQNMAGQYVPLPAELSLVVIDPSTEGPQGRVARWDFSAAESAQMLRRSLLGKGIHLQLPWPHESPRNDQLEVFARYVTADGRKLQARKTIYVTPQTTQ